MVKMMSIHISVTLTVASPALLRIGNKLPSSTEPRRGVSAHSCNDQGYKFPHGILFMRGNIESVSFIA
ncbi:hypothetical protein [uncultured Mediterranean phage uvMED]|nr:hypothetical protein [uncultured Mediterranean phage uvMED]BAQ87210.1 hypothetical protein [uncultured Mediterranean phage uvMED]BAQ87283.1 hypothetical protein [uncultured Mediterranean phage uvMED]BAQ87296.1 hypothetical protein [uncultured Mediterranean phage uvMED]BAQ87374.1 hypothetical protein [uncultured Mediterranean phage uvMED]